MGDWLLMCQLIWSFDTPPLPPPPHLTGQPTNIWLSLCKGDRELNPAEIVKYFQQNELVLFSYMEVFIDKEFSCACE